MPEKTALDLLNDKVSQLQTILNHVGAYVFTKDLEGRYTFVNKMCCELFGKPQEQILGCTDEDFFDLTISNQIRVNDRSVMDEGNTVEAEEVNIIAKTGQARIYWTVKIPLKENSGRITGMCGISTDITERRELELKVADQRQLLDTILNNIDSYVYMKDAQFRFLYANENTAKLFGRPVGQIVGKVEKDIITRDNADQFEVADRQVFESGHKVCTQESYVDETGNTHFYWSIKVPLIKDGAVKSLVGMSTDITEIVQLKEQFQHLANTDSLTGAYSRRTLLDMADMELKRSIRRGSEIALLLLDLDNFKAVNDSFGHATGDRAIIMVAEECRKSLREVDIFGRLGGDEFVAVLPDTGLTEALIVAQRMLSAITGNRVACDDNSLIAVECSIGISIANSDTTLSEVLGQADKFLYKAKRDGRNCIWHAGKEQE